jgi:hypothetical protein
LEALDGAVLMYFFMTNQMTNAAIKPRPTRPPAIPPPMAPAIAPALEPPPRVLSRAFVGRMVLVPVPVPLEFDDGPERVDMSLEPDHGTVSGPRLAVDSGRSAKTRWLVKGNL